MFELTLFCFHFAGGSARSYDRLTAAVPPWLEVQALDLPGHGARRGERALTSWSAIVEDCVQHMRMQRRNARAPYALFGHSMGARVATEVAHAMTAVGHAPLWLGVAGIEHAPTREDEPDWLTCSDARVVERLRELRGTPPELLENQALMEIVLPTLRADLSLCARYDWAARAALPCPLLALGGTQDDTTTEGLDAWRVETSAGFDVQMIEGDHFFVVQAADEVAVRVSASIAKATAGAR